MTENPQNEFRAWIISNGISEKSAANYTNAVSGPLSKWALEANISAAPLLSHTEVEIAVGLSDKIRQLDIFVERNKKGKGMYHSALRWYCRFMRDKLNSTVTADINEIYQQSEITERESLVATRLGQGKFRDSLISYWGQCAATGFKVHTLLIASHIKPWRDSENTERTDPFNGLLLIPNLDKAFDRNFISFKANGDIIISKELEEPARLGISNSINIELTQEHQKYMEYHRDTQFQFQNIE